MSIVSCEQMGRPRIKAQVNIKRIDITEIDEVFYFDKLETEF